MDLSNQNPHPRISNQPENPLQFTIHLPQSSSSNLNAIQNPNLSTSFEGNHSSGANSVQDYFHSVLVPKRKRCGRPRKLPLSLNQAGKFPSLSLDNALSNVEVSSVASSSGQADKVQLESSRNLFSKRHGYNSISSNLGKKPVDDVSEEIIVINKEATSEALIALTAGFPADSLTEEEIDYGVVSEVGGIEQVNYILIRNHIITRWRENVSNWVTKEMFIDIIPKHCGKLLGTAFGYLVARGYINFGVAPAIKERMLVESRQLNVIVVGAGLAGLAAARQLMAFGLKVTVLEGRKRAGGRVYTKKLGNGSSVAAVDLGGSVLTGTLGNPLGILARQLSFKLHKVRDKCPLYGVDGTPVDPDLDRRVENSFNQLLDKLSKLRLSMGEVSQDISLGAALETFLEGFSEEEMNLFNWHLANLEYANASLISKLSLAFWDQDDPYDMGGDHCFLPGGNGCLVEALVENVPIHYGKTVESIGYGSKGVKVAVAGGQVYEGDMVLCTVPLGVLKSNSIKFLPELPQRKLDAIRRLGFGLLNKVAMLFPHAFWGNDLDTFGHLSDHPSRRGEFFLFYSYASVAGGPLLIGLIAGEAAYRFEIIEPAIAVKRVLQILRDIYEPQGIEVPDPVQTVCTRWGSDPLSRGSYSNVAVGASGDDYDILAESVGDGRLFFAGEATNRRYPATMHGALLSGFREAANMAHYAKVRASKLKVEKNPSQNAHTCASILADLFRQPDLEFGSFAVLFGRHNADSMAILRVTFCGHRKKSGHQYSNKLLFEQLQSHFNQQQEFHVYTVLSKQQADELSEVRGGDGARLNYIEKVGVKLVGRKGLGPCADSVIASIKAERSGHTSSSSNKVLSSGGCSQPNHAQMCLISLKRNYGILKSKAASTNQKLKRKVKVAGGSNISSFPSKTIGSKVSSSGVDVESRTLGASNGSTFRSLDIGAKPFNSNKNLPQNSLNAADFVGDLRCSIPHNLGYNSGLTTHYSNNQATASSSSNSEASLNSNIGILFQDNICGSDPQNFPSSSLTSARSNSVGGVLSINDGPALLHLDARMDSLGDTNGSGGQNHVSRNGLAAPSSSEMGTQTVSNISSLAPSHSILGSFNCQNYTGDISDGISCVPNQENMFEDNMNESLPPTSSDSGIWTGKL